MLLYSLPFPATWICSVMVCKLIPGPGFRLGMADTLLMYFGIASLIGWLFAHSEGRNFTAREFRTIILYCIGWALQFEFFIFCNIMLNPAYPAHPGARLVCLAIIFTMTLNSLFIWLAFLSFGQWTIRWYLQDRAEEKTPTLPDTAPKP